jgi:small subunit ribosomal protein S17
MIDNAPETRPRRKVRMGTVVSNKMDRTIVVRIVRTLKHPMYQRVIRRSSKLLAHDQDNQASPGDRVRVMETRPLSKNKRWRLVEIIEKAK